MWSDNEKFKNDPNSWSKGKLCERFLINRKSFSAAVYQTCKNWNSLKIGKQFTADNVSFYTHN